MQAVLLEDPLMLKRPYLTQKVETYSGEQNQH